MIQFEIGATWGQVRMHIIMIIGLFESGLEFQAFHLYLSIYFIACVGPRLTGHL